MAAEARRGVAGAVIRLGRSFVAVALCSQLAHAVVYQSVLPRTGPHGYFSWYLPALTVAVIGVLIALPASVAASGLHRTRSIASLLPERRPGRSGRDILQLALASGVYFLVQESLEQTAALGSIHVASLGPIAWIALALSLFVAAVAVVALERTLGDLVVRLTRLRLPRPASAQWPPRLRAPDARPRPLAVHGALRAPPSTV